MESFEQNVANVIANVTELKAIFDLLQISINAVDNKLDVLKTEIQKSFPETFQKNILISGGIIGGEIRGDSKGGKEGGKKGGGNIKNNGDALKDYLSEEIDLMEKMTDYLCNCSFISDSQKLYLTSREQKIISLKALRKLKKLKYTEDNIRQAIYNAIRDVFWSQKFRHIKALANTSNNGCLVIDNLLKINSNAVKMNVPKTIVF